MKIIKTVYHDNLLPAYSYTVEIGNNKKEFLGKDKRNIGKYVISVWKTEQEYHPAYIYSNIDWDNDHVLYCKYDWKIEDLAELMFPEEHENDNISVILRYK